MEMNKTKLWVLAAILCISGACITTCCISGDDNPVVETQQPTIQRIRERGKLLAGTTGDYRPLSYLEGDGNYWGFGIEMAEKIAERIGVGIEYVHTSWSTLTADVLAEPQTFDLAIGGITITDA
jgi:cyclohexadienyl dehydratase